MKTYQTFSSEATKRFGEKFAKRVMNAGASVRRINGHIGQKGAVVFGLQGDLGAGKTTFVQGFFRGLGIKKRAPSPTFVIMRRHALPRGGVFRNVFHVDAYRLKKASNLAVFGFKEILADPGNIVLIEWPERARNIIPKNAAWLTFLHGKKENERSIVIGEKIIKRRAKY